MPLLSPADGQGSVILCALAHPMGTREEPCSKSVESPGCLSRLKSKRAPACVETGLRRALFHSSFSCLSLQPLTHCPRLWPHCLGAGQDSAFSVQTSSCSLQPSCVNHHSFAKRRSINEVISACTRLCYTPPHTHTHSGRGTEPPSNTCLKAAQQFKGSSCIQSPSQACSALGSSCQDLAGAPLFVHGGGA